MKRVLAMLLVLLMLSGCAQKEREKSTSAPETKDPVEEVETPVSASLPEEKAEEEPAPQSAPEAAPEEKQDPAPEREPESVPETIPAPVPESISEKNAAAQSVPEEPDGDALLEKVVEVYEAIAAARPISVYVEEPDGTVTTVSVESGRGDGNVASRRYVLERYVWSAATAEEWMQQTEAQDRDALLVLSVPEEMRIACYAGGDVVELTHTGSTTYLRAVNPAEGELFEWKLYGALAVVAENAMSCQVWNVTADGALSPEKAAETLAERIAQNYRNVPGWVTWKPLEIQVEGTGVFDAYHGQPEQFCCNIGWKIGVEDPASAAASYWQAGAGLAEKDRDGLYGWGRQVLVEKNENGDWAPVDWGTGGYSVNPKNVENKPRLEWMVEVFCLTEGWTHDWIMPSSILEVSDEELTALPAILDQLTEKESRELCAALSKCLREGDSWRWSTDTLKPLLGDYGRWLDA